MDATFGVATTAPYEQTTKNAKSRFHDSIFISNHIRSRLVSKGLYIQSLRLGIAPALGGLYKSIVGVALSAFLPGNHGLNPVVRLQVCQLRCRFYDANY